MSKGPESAGSRRTHPRGAAPAQRRRESVEAFAARLAGLSPPEWIDPIQADQRTRWQHGERIFLESYVAALANGHVPAETVLDLVYGEVLLREEFGDHPQLAEYQRRFPAHAEALARQFAVHEALEGDALVTHAVPCNPVPTKPVADHPFPTAAPVIPGYEILGEIGRGGLGVVYKARQISLHRLVALKMIRATGGPAHIARFRIEAEASARLQHPNIVQIYEVGEARGRPFLALEFVDGPTLAHQLKDSPLAPRDAARLIETIARAIHHAHLQGIIHRDLKPANILLAHTHGAPPVGFPKIADFGLAKVNDGLPGQTHSGEIVGTPAYMAPEQVQGKPSAIGPWTDIHALGIILYQMLTGQNPFRAATPMDMLVQVAYAAPAPPSQLQGKIPRDLEGICLKCLAKQPRQRYPDALALADDLRRFLQGEPIKARSTGRMERLAKWGRRRPALASMVALLILCSAGGVIAAGGLAWQSRRLGNAIEQVDRVEQDVQVERKEIDQAIRKVEEWQRKAEQAETSATGARAEAKSARERTAAAESEARKERYFSTLARSENARQNDDPARAQMLLDECPTELRGWEWNYLKRFCKVRHVTLEQADGRITAAGWRPDGLQMATAGPKKVQLWDKAGKPLATLDGQGPLAYSPDGRFLATAGSDFRVLIWDARAVQKKPLHVLRGPTAPIHALAFRPDSKQLAVGSSDRAIRVWDMTAPDQPPIILTGHTESVNAVAFSPDGKNLASGSDDRGVRYWEVAKGRSVVHRQPSKVTALAFLSAKVLAVATHDGVIRTLEPRIGKVEKVLEGHTGSVTGLVAAGPRLASVSDDGCARVWDAAGQEILRVPGFGAIAFSPYGTRFLAGERRGGGAVWSAVPPPVATTCEGHTDRVLSIAFRPDGKVFTTGGRDKTVRLWDAITAKEVGSALSRTHAVAAVAFSPDGKWLASGGGSDAESELILRDLEARKEHPLKGHKGKVLSLAFQPGAKELISAGADGTIKIWEVPGGRLVRTVKGHDGPIHALAFRPDGKHFASAGSDFGVRIWNAEIGEDVRTLTFPDGRIDSVAFSPDGTRLAAANREGIIQLWDTDGRRLRTLTGHPGAVNGIAFTPDGNRLASAGHDGTIRIWETADGREVLLLFGHRGSVNCLAFSPEGTCLASGGRDHTVRLWLAPR